MLLLRGRARKIRQKIGGTWPVDNCVSGAPANWRGWPEGKEFCFVLTHDIESRRGVDQVRQLAEMEMELGFRSSFNFIPEGTYKVPANLRSWLQNNGFEVGVHDLHHDGHLYASKKDFPAKAQRINHYLKEWGAVGFRSGFMLRQLDWMHDLDISYDASTFDTDPFEPQPDGVRKIHPYTITDGNRSYVELPYTLSQDSTMFLLLQEQDTGVWRHKLEWLVSHGAMALVNIHPDYMDFSNRRSTTSLYPTSLIRGFLEYVVSKYEGRYWQPLPCELAQWHATNAAYSAPPSPDSP
jgi:hypothetical protein